MAYISFASIVENPNIYTCQWQGIAYLSHHIANGPEPLSETFTLDIEEARTNFLAYRGAVKTFLYGGLGFAAWLDTPAERQSYLDAKRISHGE